MAFYEYKNNDRLIKKIENKIWENWKKLIKREKLFKNAENRRNKKKLKIHEK